MPPGPEGVRELIWMYRSAFPDIRSETGEMICEGDTVALRWTFTGTQTGALMGVEPTGRRVEVAGVGITASRTAGSPLPRRSRTL